jgi:hypothetical protein
MLELLFRHSVHYIVKLNYCELRELLGFLLYFPTGSLLFLIPSEEQQYYQTFAINLYGTTRERLLPLIIKMSMNGKHGKWTKTKKTSGIPFTLGKLRETM